MLRKFQFVLCCALGVAGLVLAEPVLAQKKRAALVFVDAVVLQQVNQTIPILGRLVALTKGVVAARIRAPIDHVKVDVGDRVKAGQVLAILVSERLLRRREQESASLKQRRAGLQTRRAQLRIAQQAVKRLKKLRANRSAAFRVALYEDKQLELLQVRSQVAEAVAAVGRAKADLNLAQLDLDYVKVLAPFAGVVTEVHREAGGFVDVGQPVVSLLADGQLEVEAEVPADRLAALAAGTEIKIYIVGQAYLARVRAQLPEENTLTRTRAVRFSIIGDNSKAAFAANQTVTVEVPIRARKDVLTVHKDAIINRNGVNFVYVVKEGKAMRQNVQLGDGIGNRFEVKSGIAVGDVVVIRGNERLFPGQAVDPRKQKS